VPQSREPGRHWTVTMEINKKARKGRRKEGGMEEEKKK
jgi:hypothetical protein